MSGGDLGDGLCLPVNAFGQWFGLEQATRGIVHQTPLLNQGYGASDMLQRLRDCPVANDYIARGILVKDASNYNRLALASGAAFPMSFQGRDMREKLETYLRGSGTRTAPAREAPPHLAEANIYQCSDVEVMSESPLDTLNLIEALVQHAHTGGKSFRFDGVEIKTGPPKNVKKPTPEVSKGVAVAARQGMTNSKTTGKSVTIADPPVTNTASTNGFRYSTPIEDPEAVGKVLELIRKATITMSAADVLSIAPGVRKELKDLITARRVAANMVEDAAGIGGAYDPDIMFHEEALPDVGHLMLTLRQLTPLVGGRIRPECVLDPGSMIVAMRKDVWIALGAALDTDTTTTMQSANRSLNSTMGVIPSVTFDVEGVVLRMPVHVVADAPYEVLLGRPFFAFGSVTTQDFRDGDQYLTIRDPRTGNQVTVPSLERRPRRSTAETEMVTVEDEGVRKGEGDVKRGANRSVLYIPEVANIESSSAYAPCVRCKDCPCRRPLREQGQGQTAGFKKTQETPRGQPGWADAFVTEVVRLPRKAADEVGGGTDAFGLRASQAEEEAQMRGRLHDGKMGDLEAELEDGDYLVYEDEKGTTCVEVFAVKRYKKVADKVVPVSATLPEEFRIVRREPEGVLEDCPEMPDHPPEFVPGTRYTAERREETPVDPGGFLWPEERRLAEWVILTNEAALAWTEQERGAFSRDCFDPIVIPTIPHTPWVLKNIPIPKGIHDRVCEAVKTKIATGVSALDNSFCTKTLNPLRSAMCTV